MSPKNKGVFGRGKPPITEPDEFITGVQTTAERLKPYVPHIVLGSSAVLIAALAVALFTWLADRRAAAATEAFADVVEVTGQRVGMPVLTPDGQLGDPEYDTAEARAEEALSRLEKLRDEHGSAKISKRARLLEGKLLLELGRYGEAREAYQAVADSDATELLQVKAREGIGYSLEEEALAADDAAERERTLERALEIFEAMQPDQDGPMRAYALYHQGRILGALGRKDDAVARFEDARAVPSVGIGVRAEIDDRIALLDAPPAPAPQAPASGDEADDGDADAPAEEGEAPAGEAGTPADEGQAPAGEAGNPAGEGADLSGSEP